MGELIRDARWQYGILCVAISQVVHMYCSGPRLSEIRDTINAADQLIYKVAADVSLME